MHYLCSLLIDKCDTGGGVQLAGGRSGATYECGAGSQGSRLAADARGRRGQGSAHLQPCSAGPGPPACPLTSFLWTRAWNPNTKKERAQTKVS